MAVALTTITGYVLGNASFDKGVFWVTLGIFFMACAASVLNHVQESQTDALMHRTRNRPIPAGKISKGKVLIIFALEFVTGAIILALKTNITTFILALLALIWYNFIYTYMKRISAHAVIPGSVIGAIPPLAGWAASGGELADPRAWVMALFFFVWQVPHFYLLVMKYGEQYEKAGIPSLTGQYSERIIRLMIFLWILTTAIASLFLYLFGVIESTVSAVIIFGSSLWLLISFFIPVVNQKKSFEPFRYFMRINFYVLLVIILLNLDNLFEAGLP